MQQKAGYDKSDPGQPMLGSIIQIIPKEPS